MKKRIDTTFTSLGTVNNITAFDIDDATVIKLAAQRVREIHDRFSAFSDSSDITAINKAAGKEYVHVHEETLYLLQKAKAYALKTGGAFDPTIRPLVKLWNIKGKPHVVPDASAIRDKLNLIAAEDIMIDQRNSRVMLRKTGQELDLGGIAKGYAADEVRRILQENNVKEAIINLGGTAIVLGTARQVGIQHPDFQTGTPMGSAWLKNQAAVTSGCYENYYMHNGRRYHHILDPHTGYPSDSGLKSVTLIGESAMALDALSTAVFVLGIDRSLDIIREHKIDAIFMTTANQVFVTAGLRESLTILPLMKGAI